MFSFQQSLSVLLLGLQQGHKWVNWMKRKKIITSQTTRVRIFQSQKESEESQAFFK